ncbi:MAG: hypothetical protein ACRC6X_00095 [Culicoidibacterales bacterium]
MDNYEYLSLLERELQGERNNLAHIEGSMAQLREDLEKLRSERRKIENAYSSWSTRYRDFATFSNNNSIKMMNKSEGIYVDTWRRRYEPVKTNLIVAKNKISNFIELMKQAERQISKETAGSEQEARKTSKKVSKLESRVRGAKKAIREQEEQ